MNMYARLLVLSLTAGTLGALAAPQPAAAAQVTFANAPQLSWVYTDQRARYTTFPVTEGHAPVGSWRDTDGHRHTSRDYLTYDLTPFLGKTITQANVFLRDDRADNCDLRNLEVRETAVPAKPPTWRHSPTELGQLGTLGSAACPGVAQVVVTDRVRAAVAAGKTRLAIEIRVPAGADPGEEDVRLGRSLSWFYNVHLSVGYNSPPMVRADQLYNNARACDAEAPYTYLGDPTVQLGAVVNDPDANSSPLTVEFAIWPVDHPDARTVLTRENVSSDLFTNVTVPAGTVLDGLSYGWAARVSDGTDTSAWSRSCYFTRDATPPAAPPGAESANYPEGVLSPGGRAPTFTFSANGVEDVAAYQYSFDILGTHGVEIGQYGAPVWTDPFETAQFVRPAAIGGSATVTVPVPRAGLAHLSVRSYDHAYNASSVRVYEFFVTSTDPTVTATEPPVVGQPTTLSFAKHPDVPDVVEYTYRIDNDAAHTVAAGPDGSATVDVTLTSYGSHSVRVSSRSSNGWVSSEGGWAIYLDNTPTVTSESYPESTSSGGVGVAGTFTFHPGSHGAASYVYSFNDGPESTVAAEADGTATVSYAPHAAGFNQLEVRAVDPAGFESMNRFYSFQVADLAIPTVTSSTYPENASGGGVGVTGTFTFRSGSASTVSFVYSFDFGPETTVAAGADGATISYTPDSPDFHLLYVYAADENGAPISDPYFYYFFVASP